jgi:hypothetical protein
VIEAHVARSPYPAPARGFGGLGRYRTARYGDVREGKRPMEDVEHALTLQSNAPNRTFPPTTTPFAHPSIRLSMPFMVEPIEQPSCPRLRVLSFPAHMQIPSHLQ